jgi:hypothetical protein
MNKQSIHILPYQIAEIMGHREIAEILKPLPAHQSSITKIGFFSGTEPGPEPGGSTPIFHPAICYLL